MNDGRRCRRRYPVNGPRRQSGIVLVMGDGESEKVYFERLSDLCRNVHIKSVATAKTGPSVLIRKTKEHIRKSDLDPKRGDIVAIVIPRRQVRRGRDKKDGTGMQRTRIPSVPIQSVVRSMADVPSPHSHASLHGGRTVR